MLSSGRPAREVTGSRSLWYLSNLTLLSHFSGSLKRWWGVKGGGRMKGWEGGWSISSNSRHVDRMAATAAKQSETDRQKSLIRNTRSFKKTALSVMDAWHWPLTQGRCIYQGCRTMVFACKLFSSLGKMLLCFTCQSCKITTICFISPFLSVLLDVSYKASNLGNHILKTVSSINSRQIYFKNGRGKMLWSLHFSRREIFVYR